MTGRRSWLVRRFINTNQLVPDLGLTVVQTFTRDAAKEVADAIPADVGTTTGEDTRVRITIHVEEIEDPYTATINSKTLKDKET